MEIRNNMTLLFDYAEQNKCEVTIQEFTKSQFFIIGLMTYLISIMFHELGHWLALLIYQRRTVIRFGFFKGRIFCGTGDELDYINLSSEQKNTIYIFGIVLGFMPILLSSYLFNPAYLILSAPYFFGCWMDIKLILNNLK